MNISEKQRWIKDIFNAEKAKADALIHIIKRGKCDLSSEIFGEGNSRVLGRLLSCVDPHRRDVQKIQYVVEYLDNEVYLMEIKGMLSGDQKKQVKNYHINCVAWALNRRMRRLLHINATWFFPKKFFPVHNRIDMLSEYGMRILIEDLYNKYAGLLNIVNMSQSEKELFFRKYNFLSKSAKKTVNNN